MVQPIYAVCPRVQPFRLVADPCRITSVKAYDNTGNRYDVRRVIDDNASLNIAAYEEYSPLYLT